jgi:precorrin-4/cobalt-precorrin-4 C11-methyltransferase
MAFYLSVHLIKNIVDELLKGGTYQNSTPVAVVYKATWEDEKIIVGSLGNIADKVKEAKITKTAIIIVGNVINPSSYEFSKVYDPKFTHGYRRADISK